MTEKGYFRETALARLELDAAIKQDDRILEEVLMLLSSLAPLSVWPPHLVSTLAGAIAEDDTNAVEAEKARRLIRHLFGDMPPPLRTPAGETSDRWSDRLRADLADLVTFGAGLHLVDYDAFIRR